MMFDPFLNIKCDVVGNCFRLSKKDSWDSKDLVNKMFKTEWGRNILKGITLNEFSCEDFMYEGLQKELGIKKGKSYNTSVLWYSGYLYKYLGEKSKCSLEEIFLKAPIDLLDKRYGFYHTQDWDYVKEDLGL